VRDGARRRPTGSGDADRQRAATPDPERAATTALRVEELVVEAGGHRILDGVSLRVERSEFLCLLGPNGGGKTTLLKAVLGLLPVAKGRIEVLGSPRSARRHAATCQRTAFATTFPATAADLIVAARNGAWPLRVGTRRVARAGPAPWYEHLSLQTLATLSGGEMQRAFWPGLGRSQLLLLELRQGDARAQEFIASGPGSAATRGILVTTT
jgi:ABC-type Mn2+/Zn2+ transport system ATPase subunit